MSKASPQTLLDKAFLEALFQLASGVRELEAAGGLAFLGRAVPGLKQHCGTLDQASRRVKQLTYELAALHQEDGRGN